VLAWWIGCKSNGTLAVTPTFFEVTTAMGFEMFRRAGM
jgi:folylpolyglutamate synthase/dihydropteroate synthase